ncbi:putative ABC transporter-associated repeat protein [Diaminobutyricimonas aerilata]|uniref:Putative ABC transporter-associated repeat protein n=1 Tax=Diaminobutyricimonas aerilata TaxID=1162967 RepID=A0A2M9CM83_9MICO|nr:TIGR03773 family transporter-associated surface protein [Diaminobutyricimonas aerilata]PJJ72996.1 putative ABC transporter-associated repeat protein [Diaminobutyricimonas aerilata]
MSEGRRRALSSRAAATIAAALVVGAGASAPVHAVGLPDVNAHGAVVLNGGTLTLASTLEGGHLSTRVETTDARHWAPENVIVHAPPSTATTVGAEQPHLGDPGTPIWTLPSEPTVDAPTLGWSIAGATAHEDVLWTLEAAEGAGDVVLTAQPASTEPLFSTRDGVDDTDAFPIPAGTTAAGPWAFTAEGVYCLSFTRSVTPTGGTTTTDAFPLTIAVGDVDVDGIDPADCTAEEPPVEEPTDPVWDVPNGAVNAAGATVLNDGHVDVAALVDGGALVTRVKDTTESSTPTWRDPDATVLQLLPGSRTTVPDLPAFSFLGVPGADLWQLSHIQQPGLLWPGWSTEAIPAGSLAGGVSWALTGADGPGDFLLYQPSAQLGAVDVLFSTRDGITAADGFAIPQATHAHGAWSFTAEGDYCLAFQRAATLPSGAVVRDDFTLAVAVGTADVMGLDPADCADRVGGDPGSTPPPPAPGPAPQTPDATAPVREVPAAQCTASATILSAGHIDYASRIVDGGLRSLIGDDTSGTKVYRDPEGVILWLKPDARLTLPGGYGAVGPAGSTVWQVPQSQNPALIWLGWNTESLNSGNARGTVSWSLDRVQGPGSVKVYLTGAFGGVQTMVFDGGGRYEIPLGVHAHANWAFSTEGVYRLTMTQAVTLSDGRRTSDTSTVTVAVGAVDPASAAAGTACGAVSRPLSLPHEKAGTLRSASQVSADAASADARPVRIEREGDDPVAAPFAALTSGAPVPLLLSVLGALLLAGAVFTGALWWTRSSATRSGVSRRAAR